MKDIQEKISEAEYRLLRLHETNSDKDNFKHEINVFVVSAQSIVLIIRKKHKGFPGFRGWCNNYMKNNAIMSFFRTQRNLTVHEKPIKPSADVILRINEDLSSGTTESSTEYIWYYDDFDDIDAISLSEKYLEEIKVLLVSIRSKFGEI
jgi:hypothetical protein